jgi:hypothetical protein
LLPLERLVDVVHGEHDAQVAERVHRGVPVIRDGRRREKPGELETAVADRRGEIIDDDSYVVHPCQRHVSNLQARDSRHMNEPK